MKKIQVIKRFSDKEAAKRGKPQMVEVSKDGEFIEVSDERAKELIKLKLAVEFKEKEHEKETKKSK